MSAPVRQFSFSAGELSPSLYARTDLDRYANGLRTIRNMMVMRQGGATGRPGTQYVGTALNGGNPVRPISFTFNETGIGQSYVLEFGNRYIAFYQDGGNVISATQTISGATQANPCTITSMAHGFVGGDIVTISGIRGMTQLNNGYFIVANAATNTFTLKDLLGNNLDSSAYSAYISGGTASKIYIISSPYAQADLDALDFGQSADVLTITHHSYAPAELRRSGATSWALVNITFGSSITAPSPVSTSPAANGLSTGYPIVYNVSTVGPSGEESSAAGYGGNYTNPPTANSPITISWAAVAGAAYYNIYKTTTTGGIGGFLQSAAGDVTTFKDDGSITPNFDITTPIHNNPFPSAGNYPAVVGFAQQRRGFANTLNNPVGFWYSQPGSFPNFDISTPLKDSDSISGTLSGQEVNQIQALAELKFMLMLTAGAEIYVQGNGSGIVTPSAINASVQSQYGASSLRPIKAGDQLIFCQSLGSAIRDFAFDFAIDGYRGNDITVFSAHLFEGYQIVDWCYQKVPDSMIWCVRSDGALLSCTYMREQQIIAWARHDLQGAEVENICSIPENGHYAVYLSVKRTINGQTVRYIERMSQRIWQDPVNDPPVQNDPINASYLDCFLQYDGRNSGTTTMTLTAPLTEIEAGVNDTISILFTSDPAQTITYLIVAAGSYTPANLAVAVGTALMQTSSDFSASISGGKLLIQNSNISDIFTLFPAAAVTTSSAGPLLGFPDTDYLSSNASPTVLLAPYPPGFSPDDDAYQQSLLLTSSVAFFNSGMIGDQIFLEDDEWIQSQGKEGNQVRCIIQLYTDSQNVVVTPDTGVVPLEFRGIAITTWARAVDSVSGLLHIEGEDVSIWADRFVVGSPLNAQVTTAYTVSGGAITLDKPYSVIYVGLPMIQDLQPLDLESYMGETMLARRKRVSQVSVYVYNTRTFFVGGENPDTNQNNTEDDPLFELYEEKDGASQATYDVAPALLTKQDYVITPSRWTNSGRVFFRNVDPVPFTLLAIAPFSEDPVQTPYKRGG